MMDLNHSLTAEEAAGHRPVSREEARGDELTREAYVAIMERYALKPFWSEFPEMFDQAFRQLSERWPRLSWVFERRMRGATYREIGAQWEVSGSRIQQLYEKALRRLTARLFLGRRDLFVDSPYLADRPGSEWVKRREKEREKREAEEKRREEERKAASPVRYGLFRQPAPPNERDEVIQRISRRLQWYWVAKVRGRRYRKACSGAGGDGAALVARLMFQIARTRKAKTLRAETIVVDAMALARTNTRDGRGAWAPTPENVQEIGRLARFMSEEVDRCGLPVPIREAWRILWWVARVDDPLHGVPDWPGQELFS